ncbi:MAG: insulinase family protein [Candidatus Latescibacterota bacterium]|nr:MAG: insulinase family protein [Candidatus Latescibacterota bacterium]
MRSRATQDNVVKKVLPNGLTVIFKEDRSNPVVAVNVWFKVGSAHETDEMSGLAHFQEHMVFKGTEKYGVGDIANLVKSAGGNLNAATSYSYTMYHIVLPSRAFSLGLSVQADAMMNSTFDPAEFDKERLVVIDEARMYDDTPDAYTYYRAMELGYQRHNYRRPIAGYEKVVSAFTRDQLLDFYRTYYRPGNAVLVVVGDVDREHVLTEIETVYGQWSNGRVELPGSPVEPQQKEFRFKSARGAIDHAYLGFGFHGPSILESDYPALEVLTTLLGSGKSSRLYRRVLEEKHLVTTVATELLAEKWPGCLLVFASTTHDKWPQARDALFEELVRFTEEPVEDEELLKARRQVERWMYSELETVEGQAANLGYYEVMGDYRLAKKYREAIKKVTADEILAAARKYLKLENCSLVTYLPEENGVSEPQPGEVKSALAALQRPTGRKSKAAVRSKKRKAKPPKTTSPKTGQPDEEEKQQVELFKLDNGLRVLIKRRTTVPMVSVLTVFQGGTRLEPKGKSGLSLLSTRALLKGTRSYDADEIANKIEGLGGSIEGLSGFDLTGVYLNVLSEHLEDALDVYKEVIREPTFAADKVEREKSKLLKELSKRHDHPVYYSVDHLFANVFGDHPYAHPFIGDESQLMSLGTADCDGWYRRGLVPANTVAVFVGDITAPRASEVAQRLFGDLEPGPIPRPEVNAPEHPINPGLHQLRRNNLKQAVGLVGFTAPPMLTDEAISLRVLDGLMTGLGGRLFVELRDKRSLGYMVGSAFMPLMDRSMYYGYSNPNPDGIDEAIEVILRELTRVTTEPVTDEELKKSKEWLIGSQMMKLQRNLAQAIEYGFYEALGFGYGVVERLPGLLQNVGKEDIQKAAASVFDRDKAVCIKLVPAVDEE